MREQRLCVVRRLSGLLRDVIAEPMWRVQSPTMPQGLAKAASLVDEQY